jgi:hypothetical protein
MYVATENQSALLDYIAFSLAYTVGLHIEIAVEDKLCLYSVFCHNSLL